MNANRVKIVQRQINFLQHQRRLLPLIIDGIINIDSTVEQIKAILDNYNISYQIYLQNVDIVNNGQGKERLNLINNSLLNYQKQLELLQQSKQLYRSYGSSDLAELINQNSL